MMIRFVMSNGVDDAFGRALRAAAEVRDGSPDNYTHTSSVSAQSVDDDVGGVHKQPRVNRLREFVRRFNQQQRKSWSPRWSEKQIDNGGVVQIAVDESLMQKLYAWLSGPRVTLSVIGLVCIALVFSYSYEAAVVSEVTSQESLVHVISEPSDDLLVEPAVESMQEVQDVVEGKSFFDRFTYLDCDDLPYPDMRCDRSYIVAEKSQEIEDVFALSPDEPTVSQSDSISVLDIFRRERIELPMSKEGIEDTPHSKVCDPQSVDQYVSTYSAGGKVYIDIPANIPQIWEQFEGKDGFDLLRGKHSVGQCSIDFQVNNFFSDECQCLVWKNTAQDNDRLLTSAYFVLISQGIIDPFAEEDAKLVRTLHGYNENDINDKVDSGISDTIIQLWLD